MIQVVEPQACQVALGLFQSAHDNGRERFTLWRLKVRRFAQEYFASAIILIVSSGERATAVKRLEPLAVNKRNKVETGVPRTARFKLNIERDLFLFTNGRARSVLDAQHQPTM